MRERLTRHSANAWTILTDKDSRRSETIRHYAFSCAERISPAIVTPHGEYRFLVSTHDKAVGESAYVHGSYELNVARAAISRMAQELGKDPIAGKVFVDVGANIGTTAIPAALEWNASKVIAIEPSPENVRLLRCNTILNDCSDRVECVQAAITNVNSSVSLALSSLNSGDNRVVGSENASVDGFFGESTWSTVDVPGRTLDEVVRSQGHEPSEIGLVWIDTQGHEAQVLESATEVIGARTPMIAEYWPYGLARSGTGTQFLSIVGESFATILDARTGARVPSGALNELGALYPGPSDFTDLLLIP